MAIITTAELATHVGIADSLDNTTLAYAATAACRNVQGWCGRTFDVASASSARYYRVVDTSHVWIDDCTGVSAVALDSGDAGTWATTLTTADYTLWPVGGVGPLGAADWPYTGLVGRNYYRFSSSNVTTPALKVTATWGWAAVPEAVKLATLMIGAEFHRSRGGSVEMFTEEGQFIPIRRNGMVRDLLAPYRGSRAIPAVA